MNVAFEWDPDKAARNATKHGVTFAEARTVFVDPFVAMEVDASHSVGERRYRAIGNAASGKLLVVTFTERRGSIRLISARRAEARERRRHENG